MPIPPIQSSPATSQPAPAKKSEAPRPLFDALRIAASGLSAQRTRMDVIAQNLANVETTHTSAGGPYQRRVAQLEAEVPASTVADAMGSGSDDGSTNTASTPVG